MNRNVLKTIPTGLWLTLAAAAVNVALLLIIDGVKVSFDTYSYEYAIGNILAHTYDRMRTVGYPMVIWLCRLITGDHMTYEAVVAVQVILFFASAAVFWRLLRRLTGSERVATVFGLIYAVAPGFGDYATAIATESITISFLIFMLAAAYDILKGDDSKTTLGVFFVSLLVQLAMRPASLAISGAVAVLLIAVFVHRRRCRFALLLLTGAAFLLPAYQFARVTHALGVPTSSEVSLVNRYVILYNVDHNIDASATDNPVLKELIAKLNEKPDRNPYYDAKAMTGACGAVAFDSLLTASGSPYIGLGDRIRTAMTDYGLTYGSIIFETPGAYRKFIVEKTFFSALRYQLAPAGILFGCVILLLQWRRDRRVPWYTLLLLASLSAAVVTAILYGQDSFDRLSLPGMPALMLLFAIPFGKETLLPPYLKNQ